MVTAHVNILKWTAVISQGLTLVEGIQAMNDWERKHQTSPNMSSLNGYPKPSGQLCKLIQTRATKKTQKVVFIYLFIYVYSNQIEAMNLRRREHGRRWRAERDEGTGLNMVPIYMKLKFNLIKL